MKVESRVEKSAFQKVVVWGRSASGQKLLKYAASSAITTVLTAILIFFTYDMLRIGSAALCSFLASSACIYPSYYLNRKWAWGKNGKSHLLKEVVPFWVMALAGLGLSTLSASEAAIFARHLTSSRHVASVFIIGASFASYGILWSIRYLILNKYLFQPTPTVEEAELV